MKKENVFSVSVVVWCFSMLTLLDYLYQTGFRYSDIKVTISQNECHLKNIK
jgi:hypothetical protein